MELFWRLILAHFIADFSLQTNRIAQWKRSSRWGMLVHVITHPIVSIVLTWPYLSDVWVRISWIALNGWVVVGLIALMHYLEDEWRVWSIQQTGRPDSTAFFLWDQMVHFTIIAALTPHLAGRPSPDWIFIVLCFVLLAHFTSVLIFFIENDLWGKSNLLEHGKYEYIVERLIIAALFLLPDWGIAVAYVAFLGFVFRLYRASEQRSWVHRFISGCNTLCLGLVARNFFY